MFDWMTPKPSNPYQSIGTTNPIFVPEASKKQLIRPGENYFMIKIENAQVAFSGSIWENVKGVIITSRVNLNHPLLGDRPIYNIQRTMQVKKDRAEQLGMSPVLVKLVPTTMSHVSLSIDFVLDKENRLGEMAGLINNDNLFLSVLSFTPGAVAVAQKVGQLAQKIIQTYIKPEEQQPILQFQGDLNLVEGFREGKYVILGTRDERFPLPDANQKIGILNGMVTIDDRPVTQHSYVVLSVTCVKARTRALCEGAGWEEKLRLAEAVANRIKGNRLVNRSNRNQSWEECLSLIKEGQILLLSDPNYLTSEANAIIATLFSTCFSKIFDKDPEKKRGAVPMDADESMEPEIASARNLLKIPSELDIKQSMIAYAKDVYATQQAIKKLELS